MRRAITVLLTLCLLLGTVPAAQAAGTPWLTYRYAGGNAVELTLEGMEGRVYGVQLELELNGRYDQVYFTPAGRAADVACRVEDSGSRTLAYVYLVPEEAAPLGGSRISLGLLEADGGIALGGNAWITLLDRELGRYAEADETPVRLREEYDPYPDTGSGSTGGTTYQITVANSGRGTLQVSHTRARQGERITITAEPEWGYMLSRIAAVDGSGAQIELLDREGGGYSFIMPRSQVEIRATFIQTSGKKPEDDSSGTEYYSDVSPVDWFYKEVGFVTRKGLMNGTGGGRFSPYETTTRGMIVTILYRLEGSPVIAYSPFPDVPMGQYYSQAVAWASANGIVTGYPDGRFGPDDCITPEQLMVILYRYAQSKGYSVTARVSLSGYADVDQVGDYALTAMQWAGAEGILAGTTADLLLPTVNATRGQVAAVLARFCQNILGMKG